MSARTGATGVPGGGRSALVADHPRTVRLCRPRPAPAAARLSPSAHAPLCVARCTQAGSDSTAAVPSSAPVAAMPVAHAPPRVTGAEGAAAAAGTHAAQVTAAGQDGTASGTVAAHTAAAVPVSPERGQEPAGSSGAPSSVELAVVGASEASASFDAEQVELLWRSVSRVLLRMGKGGVTDSHATSLRALLAAHVLVKVKVNGLPEEKLLAAARQLAKQAGASLVTVKGPVVLFAHDEAAAPELLSCATLNAAKIANYHERRAAIVRARRENNEKSELRTVARQKTRERNVSHVIDTVVQPGPLTRDALRREWAAVSDALDTTDLDGKAGAKPARKTKAPWKLRDPKAAGAESEAAGGRVRSANVPWRLRDAKPPRS